MIPGAALAAWLADRDAQKRSYDGVEACARKWSRHPLMNALERDMVLLGQPDPANVLALARNFIDRAEELDEMMAEMIALSRADPFFRPPMHPVSSEIHTGLLLYNHPELSIALGVTGVEMLAAKKSVKNRAASIAFTGVTTLFRYVKAGGATVSFWEAPGIQDNFVASNAGQCRLTGRRRIEDGEEILIDGRYQSFVIEHAEADMLYFQAIVRAGAAPLAAEYDSKSLAFLSASSTDEASSRVQMMVSLLRSMERDDAFPLLEAALNNPNFYTRWHIMREMLAMDAEASAPALQRMAEADPHPEVRAAAQQTLEIFFADEPETAREARSAAHH